MTPLTPLRFHPIFKPAPWGGTRLRPMFGAAPSDTPTGEAWVLSDLPGNASVVAEGQLTGVTLRELMERSPTRLLGMSPPSRGRFPLLLKFLQAREPLSVQVHPSDKLAVGMEGPDAVGKTEAWVILEADPTARLHCGLKPGTTPAQLRQAIADGVAETLLHTIAPEAGDCLFLPAGTVHSIGGGLLLFEIQQPSDLTYRLYDWNRGRELHVEKGLASVDFNAPVGRPSRPTEELKGRVRPASLVNCGHFTLARWDTDQPFRAGAVRKCRVLVGVSGRATLRHGGGEHAMGVGDVWLLPAEVGMVECVPAGPAVILECGLPT